MTWFGKNTLTLALALGLFAAVSLQSREAEAQSCTDCWNQCALMACQSDPYVCNFCGNDASCWSSFYGMDAEAYCYDSYCPSCSGGSGCTGTSNKNVLLLHGAGMSDWPSCDRTFPTNIGLPATTAGCTLDEMSSSWNWKGLSHDGNAPIVETKAAVSRLLQENCTDGKTCVVACYSTGCLRLLASFKHLQDSGVTLTGLEWSLALASAAGGVDPVEHVADYVKFAGWFFDTEELALLLGKEEVLEDLSVTGARYKWAAAQNSSPKPMYHVAGHKDACYYIGLDWESMLQGVAMSGLLTWLVARCDGINGIYVSIQDMIDFFLQARTVLLGGAIPLVEFESCNAALEVRMGDVTTPVINEHMLGSHDGLVSFHSTLGYNTVGAFTTMPSAGQRYANRVPLYISNQHNHYELIDIMKNPGHVGECKVNEWNRTAKFPADPCGDETYGLNDSPATYLFGPSQNCDGIDDCNPFYYWGPNGAFWPGCPDFALGNYICPPPITTSGGGGGGGSSVESCTMVWTTCGPQYDSCGNWIADLGPCDMSECFLGSFPENYGGCEYLWWNFCQECWMGMFSGGFNGDYSLDDCWEMLTEWGMCGGGYMGPYGYYYGW